MFSRCDDISFCREIFDIFEDGVSIYSQLRFFSIPFLGFGFLDNTIMLCAGEYIDLSLGSVLGESKSLSVCLSACLSVCLSVCSLSN